MTEEEMLALCADHDFIYKTGKEKMMICMGDNSDAILIIRLNRDHTLGFPSNIGFYPEERCWHWDEKNQNLLFTDATDKNIVAKYAAPVVEEGKYLVLRNLTKADTWYVSYMAFNMENQVQVRANLSKQSILMASGMHTDDEQVQVDAYVIYKQAEVVWLEAQTDWQLINAAWQKIVQDSELQRTCVVLHGLPSITEDVFPAKLKLEFGDETGLQLIAGPRRNVLSVLSQLLIEHNREILSVEECLPPAKLIQDIYVDGRR